jgi:hypothetical protein
MRPTRLKIVNPAENVPRVIHGWGKLPDGKGEWGLVLRPTESHGILLVDWTGIEDHEPGVWSAQPGGVADGPVLPSPGSAAPLEPHLKTMEAMLAAGQAEERPTISLRGEWRAWMHCTKDGPVVELHRKLGGYMEVFLESDPTTGMWSWKVVRKERWGGRGTHRKGTATSLRNAVHLSTGSSVNLAGEACGVRDTHRRGHYDEGYTGRAGAVRPSKTKAGRDAARFTERRRAPKSGGGKRKGRRKAAVTEGKAAVTEASLISVVGPKINKNNALPEWLRAFDMDQDRARVLVVETKRMKAAEWDTFAASMLSAYPWLRGRGGSQSLYGDGKLDPMKLQEAEREQWIAQSYLEVVAVKARSRPTLYIDPSGHDYARYSWVEAHVVPQLRAMVAKAEGSAPRTAAKPKATAKKRRRPQSEAAPTPPPAPAPAASSKPYPRDRPVYPRIQNLKARIEALHRGTRDLAVAPLRNIVRGMVMDPALLEKRKAYLTHQDLDAVEADLQKAQARLEALTKHKKVPARAAVAQPALALVEDTSAAAEKVGRDTRALLAHIDTHGDLAESGPGGAVLQEALGWLDQHKHLAGELAEVLVIFQEWLEHRGFVDELGRPVDPDEEMGLTPDEITMLIAERVNVVREAARDAKEYRKELRTLPETWTMPFLGPLSGGRLTGHVSYFHKGNKGATLHRLRHYLRRTPPESWAVSELLFRARKLLDNPLCRDPEKHEAAERLAYGVDLWGDRRKGITSEKIQALYEVAQGAEELAHKCSAGQTGLFAGGSGGRPPAPAPAPAPPKLRVVSSTPKPSRQEEAVRAYGAAIGAVEVFSTTMKMGQVYARFAELMARWDWLEDRLYDWAAHGRFFKGGLDMPFGDMMQHLNRWRRLAEGEGPRLAEAHLAPLWSEMTDALRAIGRLRVHLPEHPELDGMPLPREPLRPESEVGIREALARFRDGAAPESGGGTGEGFTEAELDAVPSRGSLDGFVGSLAVRVKRSVLSEWDIETNVHRVLTTITSVSQAWVLHVVRRTPLQPIAYPELPTGRWTRKRMTQWGLSLLQGMGIPRGEVSYTAKDKRVYLSVVTEDLPEGWTAEAMAYELDHTSPRGVTVKVSAESWASMSEATRGLYEPTAPKPTRTPKRPARVRAKAGDVNASGTEGKPAATQPKRRKTTPKRDARVQPEAGAVNASGTAVDKDQAMRDAVAAGLDNALAKLLGGA